MKLRLHPHTSRVFGLPLLMLLSIAGCSSSSSSGSTSGTMGPTGDESNEDGGTGSSEDAGVTQEAGLFDASTDSAAPSTLSRIGGVTFTPVGAVANVGQNGKNFLVTISSRALVCSDDTGNGFPDAFANQLILGLSNPPTVGTFSVGSGESGDDFIANTDNTKPSGPTNDDWGSQSGTVTIKSISGSQIEGTYDIVFGESFTKAEAGGELRGSFSATICQ